MLVVKGLGDVHGAVDHHFVSQAGASIDPSDACPASGAIVQYRRFDAAELSVVG
jgi:hypothetical protein